MWPFTKKAKKEEKRNIYRDNGKRYDPPAAQSNEDFGTSMIVGMATDNALLGMAVGGSLAGGLVGQSLADSTHTDIPPSIDTSSPSCDSGSSFDSGSSSIDSGSCGGSFDSGSSGSW